MSPRALCLALVAAILSGGVGQAADAPKCGLERVASLEADADHGALLIKVKINGTEAWLQVDTGSPYNMISRDLADKLGLQKLAISQNVELHDSANEVMRHYVRVHQLNLNDMTADDVEFVVAGENAPAGAVPDGIFGADFLASYEVEFDIPHRKINLFTKNHCKGQVVYWTQDYTALPFTLDASMHPVLRATLDGHEMSAIFDTGATPSVLSSRTARFVFGIDPVANGDKPDDEVQGGSGAVLPVYKHRFGDLEIGGVQFRNTEFYIMPDKTTRFIREHQRTAPDQMSSEQNAVTPLTIGLHHLSRLRAFVSYSEGMIYISAGDAQ